EVERQVLKRGLAPRRGHDDLLVRTLRIGGCNAADGAEDGGDGGRQRLDSDVESRGYGIGIHGSTCRVEGHVSFGPRLCSTRASGATIDRFTFARVPRHAVTRSTS